MKTSAVRSRGRARRTWELGERRAEAKASLVALATLLVACGSSQKRSETPAAAPQADYARNLETNDDAHRPSPSTASEAVPGGPQAAGAGSVSARSVALQKAASDVETSRRELDVAAGDCRNACRALGSMDRAAGRLCALAQSDEEQRRCDDAKKSVYGARDRVKGTCGACPDVSVERTAPIPSR